MIYRQTILHVADNSGALLVRCIGIPGGTRKRSAKVGEEITCSIISIRSGIKNIKVKKGSVVRAIIVTTKGNINRSDGSQIMFGQNSVILLDQAGKFFSTRIFGTVCRELQNSKISKALSIAKEVI